MPSFSLLFLAVPLLMILLALVGLVRGVLTLLAVTSLNSRGRRARGTVVGAHVQHHSSGSRSRTTRSMAETIEFLTADGERVRAVPMASDIGMLDRSGMEVEVLHDAQRPERFVAPRDGRALGIGRLLARPATSIVTIVVAVVFIGVAQGMLSLVP